MDPVRAIQSLLLAALLAGGARAQVPAAPGTEKRHADGALESCVLAQDHSVGGHALPAGTRVFLGEDGRLQRCRLGREAPFNGQPLPADSTVFFERDGSVRGFWLRKDTLIQGHLVWGNPDGASNRLHPNGKLRAIWLAGDEVIDGVPCSSSMNPFKMGWAAVHLGTRRMAFFHDNGRLQQAMLARDATIQERVFRKGELISLTREGVLDPRARILE